MLKFSIIVPIYNVEKYLEKCIKSLIEQTYKNIEIILVDDGSPDNSPKICDDFAAIDDRIKVIHKINGGLVSARQAGIEIATGDYVVCVDGDDWISIQYCEKMLSLIELSKPDIICCGCYNVFDNNHHKENILSNRKGFYDRKDIEKNIFPILIHTKNATNFSPSIAMKTFKLDLYKKFQLQVDQRIGIAEDSACTVPCIYNAQSLFIIEDCLYYYRQNETSMTKARKAFRWDVPKIFFENIKENIDIDTFDFRQQLYRKVVHELFLVAVSQFNRKESYSVIKEDIKRIIEDKTYQEAIKNAFFSRFAGKLALFALKHKAIFLIMLYSKLK